MLVLGEYDRAPCESAAMDEPLFSGDTGGGFGLGVASASLDVGERAERHIDCTF